MRTDEPRAVQLKDYRAPDFRIDTIDLDFVLDPATTRVAAKMHVTRTGAKDAALVLNGEQLKLINACIDGKETPYHADAESLTLRDVPDDFVLEIITEIGPASNTTLEGLYVSKGIFCTQCEAEGFRRITYYLDRPDNLAVFTTRIEADKTKYPVLLSNGNLIKSGDLDEGRHFATWHDPFPKPSYLFALVAGDLGHIEDSFTTMSGRKVDLRIYVEHGNEPRATYAMDSLKRAMKWDEEAYGREYDLDIFMIVAVSAFNM
ncbi:MAG TPA: aminopeptidase N, partial [Rhizomicrobium sp.]